MYKFLKKFFVANLSRGLISDFKRKIIKSVAFCVITFHLAPRMLRSLFQTDTDLNKTRFRVSQVADWASAVAVYVDVYSGRSSRTI